METTATEFAVDYTFSGNSNVEGAYYATESEAREAFETECSSAGDDRTKKVRLLEVECTYDDGDCVDVSIVRVIESMEV